MPSGRARLGDYAGAIADLERCIELAVPINSLEAARAWHNLHIPLWHIGELDRAVAACEEAVRIGERLGGTLQAAGSRAQLPWLHVWKGDWDVALEGAEAAIAETQAVGATYWEFFPRLTRARIHFGRGLPESTVLEDVERALEIGRSLRDPNPLLNTLVHAASLFYELGLVERARATAAELVPIVVEASATGSRFLPLLANIWFAESLGLDEHIRTLLTSDKTMTEAWRRPYEAVLAGEYALAADLFASLGYVDEGYARLKAAEQLIGAGRRAEADEQLGRALDFFRNLGATRYVRQAEALLRVPA